MDVHGRSLVPGKDSKVRLRAAENLEIYIDVNKDTKTDTMGLLAQVVRVLHRCKDRGLGSIRSYPRLYNYLIWRIIFLYLS